MDQTIDPKTGNDLAAQNLAKAIRQRESGGNFNAVGDAGTSHGGYQFQEGTWKQYSKEILGKDNAEMTPENQNAVAYGKIKSWKDQGKSAAEIAAMWNAGENIGDKWQTHKGKTTINGQTLSYDTPQYVKDVTDLYQGYKNGTNAPESNTNENGYVTSVPIAPKTDQTPRNNTQNDESLTGQLKGRLGDISTAASDTFSGKQGITSGILQGVGAVAGGIGDITNKALELIPGVKQVENLIGEGIGALAKTSAGQAVAKSISEFSQEHPELAKDIGAGFNIVTAIPILRGLGTVGQLGLKGASQALKGIAEKSFIKGAPELIAATKSGATFLERNPNIAKDMVDRRLIGDIKGGEYVTKEAINSSERGVKVLNKEVNNILEQPRYSEVGQDGNSIAQKVISGFTDRNGNVIEGFPNSGLTPSEIIANAKKLDPVNKLLWDKFEAGQANWKEINKLRSALDGKVKKVFIQGATLDTPEIAVSKELGAGLSSAMRDALQSTITETQPYFKEMATQFNIQKALGYMDGKKIQPGTVAGLAGHAVGAGTGGAVGGMIGGTPGAFIGGLIGDRTAGKVASKLAGRNITQGILKRTGNNAKKLSKQELKSKLGGLFGGAVSQKANQ